MNIAIIGTGHVGGALGTGWARAGHDVTFGAREPQSAEVKQLVESATKAKSASPAAATASAEVIALAVPWKAVPDVLKAIEPNLAGKILIDCTNPVKEWPEIDSSSGSGGEQVAKLAPGAKVVKSFNTTGFENMQTPKFGNDSASMFYAGDDKGAKNVVRRLVADLGFDPVDVGPLSQSNALEAMASLWAALAYGQQMGRGIAFRLLRR